MFIKYLSSSCIRSDHFLFFLQNFALTSFNEYFIILSFTACSDFFDFHDLLTIPYYEKRKVSHISCNHWTSQPLIADILLNLSHLLPPPFYFSIENVKFIFPTPNCLFDLSHISNFSCPNVHPNVFHLPSTQST